MRLCLGLDKLISLTTQSKGRKKRRMRKAQKRLRHRIKNLVDEVHKKTVHFLVNNFTNIIIPPFQVSQMIKRKNRKINSKTVRQMVCWRHYGLRMRLLQKCQRLTNVNVFVRGEEYTTKTCTHCLTLKNIKGEKTYKCCHCNVHVREWFQEYISKEHKSVMTYLCHDFAALRL